MKFYAKSYAKSGYSLGTNSWISYSLTLTLIDHLINSPFPESTYHLNRWGSYERDTHDDELGGRLLALLILPPITGAVDLGLLPFRGLGAGIGFFVGTIKDTIKKEKSVPKNTLTK